MHSSSISVENDDIVIETEEENSTVYLNGRPKVHFVGRRHEDRARLVALGMRYGLEE